jgi:cephalosporin hydroxylase
MGRAISGEHRHGTFFIAACWLGKTSSNLWAIREIIHETQPKVVIEIGCKFGGTTLWLSSIMKIVALGRALSIDLGGPAIPFPENIDFIQGDGISDETLAIVCRNWADFARPGNDRTARGATSRT